MEENTSAAASEPAAPAAENSAANTRTTSNENREGRENRGEREGRENRGDRGNRENRDNRDNRDKDFRGPRKGYKRAPRKKVCVFCQEKVAYIDYKDVARLRKFITEGAKMIPRRMTGTCAKHQRELAKAIKKARIAALLPFVGE